MPKDLKNETIPLHGTNTSRSHQSVNAFVSFGDFGSIFLQSLVAVVSIGFVLYLCFVHLASARVISNCLSFCSSPCLLFLISFTSQGFLIVWVLLLCLVSSTTLVYFIFIGSIYSFCALVDQQCFDFKVLIPAIVSKISNNKLDMVFCAEKKELLCSQGNNQIWAFIASFVCCLASFGGALVMQNFIVFRLGKGHSPLRSNKEKKHHYEMKESVYSFTGHMEHGFESLARNFFKHSWDETSLTFPEPPTSVIWNPQADFTYVGDIKGTMQSVHMLGPALVPCASQAIVPSRITDIAVNPSGNLFASSSSNESYVILGNCHSNDGSIATTAQLPSTSHPLCVSFMEDHRSRQSLILIGSRRGIRIVDSESGALFREMTSKGMYHNYIILYLCLILVFTGGATSSLHTWSGCMIASGNLKGGISLWDARTQEPISHFSAKKESQHEINLHNCKILFHFTSYLLFPFPADSKLINISTTVNIRHLVSHPFLGTKGNRNISVEF
uniref:WD_REPEATS_REGION domain-containing protein n=1 Tax=Heterorhabditis bacteriophora TaxID=37862 RepID=A0A1I7XCS1_HETBA